MLLTLTLFSVCFIFLIFISTVCSVLTLTAKDLFFSLFSLVALYFCSVWLLALLKLEFIAFVILLVYMGALAILFLFIIMLLPVPTINLPATYNEFLIFLFLFTPLVLFVLLASSSFDFYRVPVDTASNVEQLGVLLYTHFSMLFLLCGFILFTAVICVIRITYDM